MNISPSLLICSLTLVSSSPTARAAETDKTLDIYWVDAEGGGATLIDLPIVQKAIGSRRRITAWSIW